MGESAYDCVPTETVSDPDDVQLSRYTGQLMSYGLQECQSWGLVKENLEAEIWDYQFAFVGVDSDSLHIAAVNIETADFDLQTRDTGAFCRSARVVMDISHSLANGSTGYKRFVALKPDRFVCPTLNDNIVSFRECRFITACHTTIQSVTGVLRDTIGAALLSRQFGSDIGTSLVSCFIGQTQPYPCYMDITSLTHPDFGVCHRLSSDLITSQAGRKKATDVSVSVAFFTDSTDSVGRQYKSMKKLARIFYPGLYPTINTAASAIKVIAVPKGVYPRSVDAVTVSPGQHLELRLSYTSTTRYPKPPLQDCQSDSSSVTYALQFWNVSYIRKIQTVNLTSQMAAKTWSEKIEALRDILYTLGTQRNSTDPPMESGIIFQSATQNDCINAYIVGQITKNCGCLPSFLPIPVDIFATYSYCFNRSSDINSLIRAELCLTAETNKTNQYEFEARRLCLPPCQTRSYAIRQANYPWPGLTRENSVEVLTDPVSSLGYPINFVNARGIAGFFGTYMKASRFNKQPVNKNDTSVLVDFQYELQMLERRLVKATVLAASDFGDEISEDPSYTIKNLMADFGGVLGLWCGASVLTVFELFELIANYVAAFTVSRKRTKEQIEANDATTA